MSDNQGHKVTLVANAGTFRGLAKQNILFHQCIGELIDNAIAAKLSDTKFRGDVILVSDPSDANSIDLYVVDQGRGMDLEILKKALQLGESATTDSRLNEHGFGLKHSLATMSGGNGWWKLWTRPHGKTDVFTVEGPFNSDMFIRDDESLPQEDFLPTDISTIIKVPVKLSYLQTVQGRGAPAKDLYALREWLIEHLGVHYRGYLEQDPGNNYENSGVIVISIGTDSRQVPPIHVPLASKKTEYIQLEIGGQVCKLVYEYGTLDTVRRDQLVNRGKARFYYQGNIPTQGIDIRLGKRVIATRQFETIWKTDDGDNQLTRHNRYNDFVGELLIEELPRGVLSTVNNKTDFNLDDQNWVNIFNKLNEIRPIQGIREATETELRKRWVKMLRATSPGDDITDEEHVWPTGTRIDVLRIRDPDGQITIYELKAGAGAPEHLYQLKMYWDGLVLNKRYPREAILLCESFSTTLEQMANLMNTLPPPPGSKPYNFNIERLSDKGLR